MSVTTFVGSNEECKTYHVRMNIVQDDGKRFTFNRSAFSKAALIDQVCLHFDRLAVLLGEPKMMNIIINDIWDLDYNLFCERSFDVLKGACSTDYDPRKYRHGSNPEMDFKSLSYGGTA